MKKRKNTKEKIMKTAGELFAVRGYFGVSMQDIANELSITKAALYYHFSSKDDLTRQLLTNAVDELKQELKKVVKTSKLPTNMVFRVIKTFLDFRIKHPEINLLTGLGVPMVEKSEMLSLVEEVRNDLYEFLRDLVVSLDWVQKTTLKSAYSVVVVIVSYVLTPFPYKRGETDQMAKDLTALLISGDRKIKR